MVAHAEISDDRVISTVDIPIPEGPGADHGIHAVLSGDRHFVFFTWDNHETAYKQGRETEFKQGLPLLSAYLAVFDISDVKEPKLVTKKPLGGVVVVNAIVVGEHLFLSELKPAANAPPLQMVQEVGVFDVKSPGFPSEVDRIGNISVLTTDHISPEGNVIRSDDGIYHDVVRHVVVPFPPEIKHPGPDQVEYIDGNLITDKLGHYALTVDLPASSSDECSIWDTTDPAHPKRIRRFTPAARGACFGKMTPDFNSLFLLDDFKLTLYSTKDVTVTEERLRKAFEEASVELSKNLNTFDGQDYFGDAVTDLDGAGIELLIAGGLKGIAGKERADILTNYTRWYMASHVGPKPERAVKIMRQAVVSDPTSTDAAALLGAVALDAGFPATTETAKAELWEESRKSFENYRRLLGHDPELLAPVTYTVGNSNHIYTSVACEHEGHKTGCGYQEAMGIDFSAVLKNSKDVCDYIGQNFRLGGAKQLINLESSFGVISINGQGVRYSATPDRNAGRPQYYNFVPVPADFNNVTDIKELRDGVEAHWPASIIPFHGNSYLLIMSSTESPAGVYDPVKGKVCSF